MRFANCCLVLCLGLFSLPVASVDFTCGGHIIEVGMSLDTVRKHCGAPTEQTADRWVYDHGSTQLVVIIHVRADNTVAKIEKKSR